MLVAGWHANFNRYPCDTIQTSTSKLLFRMFQAFKQKFVRIAPLKEIIFIPRLAVQLSVLLADSSQTGCSKGGGGVVCYGTIRYKLATSELAC